MRGTRIMRFIGNREKPEKELYGLGEKLEWPVSITSTPLESYFATAFARIQNLLFSGFQRNGRIWFSTPPQPNFLNPYIYGVWDEKPIEKPKEQPFEVNLAEALVGWKAWEIEDGKLASAQQAEVYWPVDEPLVAQCREGCKDVPAEHHYCGIYGASQKETCEDYMDEVQSVMGLVYGWGRYVRGSDGWRTEFAYPKCFYLRQGQVEAVEALKAYHVPIYIEQPTLIYNPEEDGYEHRGEEAGWDSGAAEESAANESYEED